MKLGTLAVSLMLGFATAACGDDAMQGDEADGDADGRPDGGGDSDASDGSPDATPGCERPVIDVPALRAYLQTAVSELASTPRYTDTQRQRARALLVSKLQALGLTPAIVDFPNGANVSVTLPATAETDDPILVGAHFDTVPDSPGADDNASGSALVLALARFAVTVPCRRSAVTFLWFDREEEGLFGSRAAAQQYDPVFTRAVYTFDQLGYNADGDTNFELELPTPQLEDEWRDAAMLVGATLTTTNSENTDHEAFRDAGYAAVGLSEEYVSGDTTPHYHTPQDTPGTLDYDYLSLATRLAAQVLGTAISE